MNFLLLVACRSETRVHPIQESIPDNSNIVKEMFACSTTDLSLAVPLTLDDLDSDGSITEQEVLDAFRTELASANATITSSLPGILSDYGMTYEQFENGTLVGDLIIAVDQQNDGGFEDGINDYVGILVFGQSTEALKTYIGGDFDAVSDFLSDNLGSAIGCSAHVNDITSSGFSMAAALRLWNGGEQTVSSEAALINGNRLFVNNDSNAVMTLNPDAANAAEEVLFEASESIATAVTSAADGNLDSPMDLIVVDVIPLNKVAD